MSKVVAPSIRNSQFQELKDGDLAVLFFRDSCPYCKDFKPTWNRVAKSIKERWNNGDSLVYEGSLDSESLDEGKIAGPPVVAKLDVHKFPAVKNRIGFPTVPCIALYKRGQPVVFCTSQDRSRPKMVRMLEQYYRDDIKPAEHVVANEEGQWPQSAPPPIKARDPPPKSPTPKPPTPKQPPQDPLSPPEPPKAAPAASVRKSLRPLRHAMTYSEMRPKVDAKVDAPPKKVDPQRPVVPPRPQDDEVFARYLALLYDRRGRI